MLNQSNGCVRTLAIEDNLGVESVPALLCQIETGLNEGYKHFVVNLSPANRITFYGKMALQVIAARVAERGGEVIFSSGPVH